VATGSEHRTRAVTRLVGIVCGVAILTSCTHSGPLETEASTSSSTTLERVSDVSPTLDRSSMDGECRGPIAEPETFEYDEVAGVDPDLLSLDVYAATNAADCPAVLWVHGGGWQTGDKATTSTRVKAEHFTTLGFVFIALNYRLVSEANEVRWPTFGRDVAAATSWVFDHAEEVGVDDAHVTLLGHSAGAHLVDIVATNPDLLGSFGHERSDLDCVISLDTISYDLSEARRTGGQTVDLAFGTDPETLVDGSPQLQATEHAQGDPLPRFLVVTRGSSLRTEASETFASTMREVGATVSFFDAGSSSHRDVNVQLGVPDENVITPAVTEFVESCRS